MRRQVAVLSVAAALVAVAASSGTALAYPQFQMSSGTTRCNECHYSPAGGGLLRDWGRSEAADTISRGGDDEFLYGAWEPPKWLALGADFRGVTGIKDASDTSESELLLFPMQADVYSRFAFSDSLSLSVTLGGRGAARGFPRPPLGSREHYLMWQPDSTGPYVRVGRFYAPFGLRQVDHTMYVRRYMGFYSWEETYNVSGGVIENDWELHATASAPDPVQAGAGRPYGGSIMYERAVNSSLRWGLQAKLEKTSVRTRYIAGATGKWYLDGPKLLVMAEVDGARESIDSTPRSQLLGHLNLSYFPVQGLMVGAAVEHYAEDLSVADTARDAADVMVQLFPRSHWEVMLMGRGEQIGDTHSILGFLMVHYYL